MSLPEQKSLTIKQLEDFVSYNIDIVELGHDILSNSEVDSQVGRINISIPLDDVLIAHLDPTVIIDWIRDNLQPSDIWDMDEYDGEVIREYVSIGNERAYDWRNDR